MTANLDGETNLKTHSASTLTRTCTQPHQLNDLQAQVGNTLVFNSVNRIILQCFVTFSCLKTLLKFKLQTCYKQGSLPIWPKVWLKTPRYTFTNSPLVHKILGHKSIQSLVEALT